ncbi:MAG TPA: substrate-binding domain-containing protein [Acidimicrobiia bacterium]|jgi:Ca-activated chloride channel family protein
MKRILGIALAILTASAALVVAPTPVHADDCVAVPMDVQLNQFPLMPDLAKRFNGSDDAQVGGRCIRVSVSAKSSGAAATLLEHGWPHPAENGPKPVVWSPAATAWKSVLNQRLADKGQPQMAPDGTPVMVSPLVIAMPQTMAKALGWPDTPIGYSDILRLATDPNGWGGYGHPEWGQFRLGKTNPNFSTSGLSSLVAQYYAFAGKQDGLSLEDIENTDVDQKARDVESAVVHYGDTTLTFLNHLYEADARGAPLTYASAVAVEEQSVVNYNNGNPDGKLDPGEKPEPPHEKLVAIYPKEGTLFSDNPYIVLDAKWVSADQKQAAAKFGEYVQRPANQRLALRYGFRPGNSSVALGAPIDVKHGLDPAQPQATTLGQPDPAVLKALIDRWNTVRKGARVLMVIDESGSMISPATRRATKLDLAKDGASDSLGQFRPDDEVGIWAFSTKIGPDAHPDYIEVSRITPRGDDITRLRELIAALQPTNGTPLYDIGREAYDAVDAEYDDSRINAVVLLSDGHDQGSKSSLSDLRDYLQQKSESVTAPPVRIFTIAYGADADVNAMQQIAKATNGAYYDATDPSTIVDVLNAVISNF